MPLPFLPVSPPMETSPSFLSVRSCTPNEVQARFARWGEATLQCLLTEFPASRPGLFADERSVGKPKGGDPAFTWGAGAMLSALSAAAILSPEKYRSPLAALTAGMDAYWSTAGGRAGYDVLPLPKPPDRYYDDNAWIALTFLEMYAHDKRPETLKRAKKTLDFVLSGEDRSEGGLYWREHPQNTRNTCSNAPAIVAALLYWEKTGDAGYRRTALRLYEWTTTSLQDSDGLYFDHVKTGGERDKAKWSYNSALMIEANVLLAKTEKQKAYLVEARRIAAAAEARWLDKNTGAIKDEAFFAEHLAEALLKLAVADRDSARRNRVFRALLALGQLGRGEDGYFPTRWSEKAGKRTRTSLLDQASAARAFLFAATLP